MQYFGFKGLRQVSLYSVQMYGGYGGLLTNIADRLVKVEFQRIRTKISCCLLPILWRILYVSTYGLFRYKK